MGSIRNEEVGLAVGALAYAAGAAHLLALLQSGKGLRVTGRVGDEAAIGLVASDNDPHERSLAAVNDGVGLYPGGPLRRFGDGRMRQGVDLVLKHLGILPL